MSRVAGLIKAVQLEHESYSLFNTTQLAFGGDHPISPEKYPNYESNCIEAIQAIQAKRAVIRKIYDTWITEGKRVEEAARGLLAEVTSTDQAGTVLLLTTTSYKYSRPVALEDLKFKDMYGTRDGSVVCTFANDKQEYELAITASDEKVTALICFYKDDIY